MSKTYRDQHRERMEEGRDIPPLRKSKRQYPCVVCTALYPRDELETMVASHLAGLYCAACAQNIQDAEEM